MRSPRRSSSRLGLCGDSSCKIHWRLQVEICSLPPGAVCQDDPIWKVSSGGSTHICKLWSKMFLVPATQAPSGTLMIKEKLGMCQK